MKPTSPANQVNRFMGSTTIPRSNYGKPSYSSALISLAPRAITPYAFSDPFASSQPQRSSQSLNKKEKTPYIKKTFSSYLFYMEPYMAHIKDPLALAMNFMPPNWHFIPKDPPKVHQVLFQHPQT